MGRVTDPLALFGTQAVGRAGGRLPMTLVGAADPVPVVYTTPVPSAQVKSSTSTCLNRALSVSSLSLKQSTITRQVKLI